MDGMQPHIDRKEIDMFKLPQLSMQSAKTLAGKVASTQKSFIQFDHQ